MQKIAALAIAGLASVVHAGTTPGDSVGTFISETLHVSSYKRADADLNGDGRSETFVYVTDLRYCGSGGRTLFVVSPEREDYRVILRATVTHPPISLLNTSSKGWRNVGVTTGGGGTKPQMVRLRFDGRRYPSNPTVLRSIPLTPRSGKVLIADE